MKSAQALVQATGVFHSTAMHSHAHEGLLTSSESSERGVRGSREIRWGIRDDSPIHNIVGRCCAKPVVCETVTNLYPFRYNFLTAAV
jgi:hypothetical protein